MSRKREIQAAKVHRLYREYQAALEELNYRKRLTEEAQARLNQAMSQELCKRGAYNQALAEYRESKSET